MYDIEQFEKRKQDHIDLALAPVNQATELNRFDNYHLVHEALPDLDFAEIKMDTYSLGKQERTPFFISSMTAGHKNAATINHNLLTAAAHQGWAMGVGSQRRQLFDAHAAAEWQPLRKAYPQITLFGNLGIAQLLTTSSADIHRIVDSLQANALIIHCNPLQEVIQPEGTPQFKGCWDAIARLVKEIRVPIIIKETGCGFAAATLKRLKALGIAAVDVSGAGGTHWGRIEGQRAQNDFIRNRAADTYRNWGINTIDSVIAAQQLSPTYEIWGSGGVRHGLDAAKLLALGVHRVGFAKPMLAAALHSAEKVIEVMMTIEYELKVALFCTGSRDIKELRGKLLCP